jgi:hypothetical protein
MRRFSKHEAQLIQEARAAGSSYREITAMLLRETGIRRDKSAIRYCLITHVVPDKTLPTVEDQSIDLHKRGLQPTEICKKLKRRVTRKEVVEILTARGLNHRYFFCTPEEDELITRLTIGGMRASKVAAVRKAKLGSTHTEKLH